ncbi:MAG TPA: exosortase H [Rhodanobacteraceae bacterium]|nr:exosortase H [Rhodanobacteraceae bacterium]
MLKFALLFPIYLIVLFVLELLAPVDRAVIAPWTGFLADMCGALMRLLDSSVVVHGNIIAGGAAGFAIAIERGCNGVEAVIILVASMLAYPASWRQRAIGIGVGFVCVQALNMVRIISLFYLGNWNRVWFDWFHLYVWQALIVADALVVFLLWLSWIRRRTPDLPPPATPAAPDAAMTPA